MSPALDVVEVGPERAADVLDVIHRSFGARPALDPPSTALDETVESVAAVLEATGGIVAERHGQAVGTVLFDRSRAGRLGLRRVSVRPDVQAHGVASAMVGVAEDVAAERGLDGLWLHVRPELPATVQFWTQRRYHPVADEAPFVVLGKTLPVSATVESVEQTHDLARRVAGLLRAGDLLVLTGGLGAGKTTFTQGLGDALGVRGPVTSPTFVLARTHPSLVGGPALVHVDAYRLGGPEEVDDLDLDATTDTSVTVVEWGAGVAEQLSDSHLELVFDNTDLDRRIVTVTPVGPRWADVRLRTALVG